jgi:hypothetical protein
MLGWSVGYKFNEMFLCIFFPRWTEDGRKDRKKKGRNERNEESAFLDMTLGVPTYQRNLNASITVLTAEIA